MSKLQVSLPEISHNAQMRSSIALELASSGAIFKAENSVSRLLIGSSRSTFGRSLGGCAQSWSPRVPGSCAEARGKKAAGTAQASAKRNREPRNPGTIASTLVAPLPATSLESSQRDVNNAAQLGRIGLRGPNG